MPDPAKPPTAPDTFGWRVAGEYRAYGVRFGLRASSAPLLRAAEAILPPGTVTVDGGRRERRYSLRHEGHATPGAGRHVHLYADEASMGHGPLDAALDALEGDVRLFVAARARRRLFVHAGVVGWQGRAIVIPGRTFAGKSTLVAALVAAGATYFSDEYAVLDARGRVHPFARPLSLREPGRALARKVDVAAAGGAVATAPLPIGLVVAARYVAGARFRPRKLSPGETMLHLLDNTVPARSAAGRALPILREVATHAEGIRGDRGEAAETARAILRRAIP